MNVFFSQIATPRRALSDESKRKQNHALQMQNMEKELQHLREQLELGQRGLKEAEDMQLELDHQFQAKVNPKSTLHFAFSIESFVVTLSTEFMWDAFVVSEVELMFTVMKSWLIHVCGQVKERDRHETELFREMEDRLETAIRTKFHQTK